MAQRTRRLNPRVGLVALFALVGTAQAYDWKSLPKPTGYVSDFAHVIDPQSKASLEAYCTLVEEKTGAQIALVTLPSLQGEPIEDVANDLFHAWGIGKKKQDNGALFLLAIQDRKTRLEVGFGLGEAVPDGMAGLMLNEMRPALREQQYGQAFLAAAEELGGAIAKSKNVDLGQVKPRWVQETRRVPRKQIPWGFIFFLVFILIALVSRGSRGGRGGGGGGGFWTGLLLGELLSGGRRYGGYGGGGGGFGGYDSGGGDSGGFGGFGGGDSGGGGASSDW